MRKSITIVALSLALVAVLLASPGPVASQVGPEALKGCRELAFSTEEDFVSHGPEPPDGNHIISDGDLLGIDAAGNCVVCARNEDLLVSPWEVPVDLGLDAVDVIDVDGYVVAFSTELDSPPQAAVQFTAGDLLFRIGPGGDVIPNQALTYLFEVGYDIGLDAVHFVGDPQAIIAFLEGWYELPEPVPSDLAPMLKDKGVDIWFSTEGTLGPVEEPTFLDGDLLSARDGSIEAPNADLLPGSVPAGIPVRGVDFGLDAATGSRVGMDVKRSLHFSTEILFDGEPNFTDGDVLQYGDGVVATNYDLLKCFEPDARELGLDALSFGVPVERPCISRITKIAGVDIADISPVDGMALPGTVATIDAPVPFGGEIDIQGSICEDVERFRVVYRKEGSGNPWTPMPVLPGSNWMVKVDAFIPAGPDCLGSMNWSSLDPDGWYNANDYRHLTEPALGGCNPGLALTVWLDTLGAPDALHEVVLETDTTTGIVSDTLRLVQLDNTPPQVELPKVAGTCDSESMPLMIMGRMLDAHFYRYTLQITGDGYGIHTYPTVKFYDDPLDNVIDTGTVGWDAFVDLHQISVFDLATVPVECCYTVLLTGWERTLSCDFKFESNQAYRCPGCRHTTDAWTFAYAP